MIDLKGKVAIVTGGLRAVHSLILAPQHCLRYGEFRSCFLRHGDLDDNTNR